MSTAEPTHRRGYLAGHAAGKTFILLPLCCIVAWILGAVPAASAASAASAAPALVSRGAVDTGSSGAAITPAYGQTPAANDLLVFFVQGTGSTVPTAPSGWSTAVTAAKGGGGTVGIFYKVAAGGDSAPTEAARSNNTWTGQLAEYSGTATSSPLDQVGSVATGTSPMVATDAAADAASGEVVVYVGSNTINKAATASMAATLNNGVTAHDVSNNRTSSTNHHLFGYGFTTGNSAADRISTPIDSSSGNGAGAIASFKASFESSGCPTLLTPDSPPGYCTGTTYWVSASSGSDTNRGTQAQPFATVQKAANVVNPGDVVLVEDGDYTGGSGRNSAVVTLSRGGTSTAWVTFKSMNHYGAQIDGQNNTTHHGFRFTGANYVRIEGFDIHGEGNSASGSGNEGPADAIQAYNSGSPSEIVGNDIYNIGTGVCTNNTNGLVGIFLEQPNITVESNEIHDIGRLAQGESGCNSGYNSSRDHGIYVNGNGRSASGALIRNNLFWNDKKGWAIQLYPGTLSNVNVVNNDFYAGNPSRRQQFVILHATFRSSQVTNNAFYDGVSSPGPPINSTDVGGGSVTIDDNSTDSSSMATGTTGLTLSSNLLSTNPSFVNAPFNFHLATGSPDINAGASLGSLNPFDYAGTSRPQGAGYDIGAYEQQ